MKRLIVDDSTARFLHAFFRVEKMSGVVMAKIARTTHDEALLTALAMYDGLTIFSLLNNPQVPCSLLKTIAKRYEDDTTMLIEIIRHSNTDAALLADLARNDNWEVRYAVALRKGAPAEALTSLLKDENLAVRAMAARQLGLPPVDEMLDAGVTCTELNRNFEDLRQSMFSSESLVQTMTKRLSIEGVECRDSFDGFCTDCEKALAGLIRRLLWGYVRMVCIQHGLNGSAAAGSICGELSQFGDYYFDAYIVAAEMEKMIKDKARERGE